MELITLLINEGLRGAVFSPIVFSKLFFGGAIIAMLVVFRIVDAKEEKER